MKDPELVAWSMRERALQEEKTEPLVVIRQVYTPSEEQKKLYFNAGRWAGGSRDWVARKAFEELQRRDNESDI